MEPFLYQSIGGGIVFLVGLIFAWRQGYLGWSGRGLWHLLLCLGVYFLFLGMTAFLQFAPMEEAPDQAYKGGADHVLGSEGKTRGTSLDYGIMIGYFAIILIVGYLVWAPPKDDERFLLWRAAVLRLAHWI
jgi:hypothetical protein